MLRRQRWIIALLLLVPLLAGACGDSDGDENANEGDTTSTTEDQGPPEFPAGSTMAAIQSKGKIVIGTKFDQNGFGLKNPTTQKLEGFDIEIAKLIAAGIFGGEAKDAESKIEFKEAVSKNREPFIQDGTVDLVIATYTINDKRKEVVSFAGPYFVAKQDLMVKKDDTTIKSVDDLNGKKVCTVKGSTSETNVKKEAPKAEVLLFDTYSLCAEALSDGRVVAVTTDNTILAGLIQQSSGAFKLVEAPFSDEPYGIGLKKGDDAFRDFLNDELEKMFEDGSWADAFEATLGKIGLKTPQPPTIDRSTAGTSGSSTTGTGSGTGASTTVASGSGSGGSSTTTARGGVTTTTAP